MRKILVITIMVVFAWCVVNHISSKAISLASSQNKENHKGITISEISDMSRKGTDDEAIIKSINQRGLAHEIFTDNDFSLLFPTQKNISENVQKHVLKLLLNNIELARKLREKYFPISEGSYWEYRFSVKNAVRIPYASQVVRSKAYFEGIKDVMRYTIDKKELLKTGEVQYSILVDNNIFEPYPFIITTKDIGERSVINALLQFNDYKSTYAWKVSEIKRQGDPTVGDGYDIRVTEEIRVTTKGMFEVGFGTTRTTEHELLQIPIIPFKTTHSKASSSTAKYQLYSGTIKTPIGVFDNCIHKKEILHNEDGDWQLHSILAPNIGLVQQYQENPQGKRTYLLELIKYHISKNQ